MYFETRVKITSEGKRKAFCYLVDAMSFTEAESKTLKAVEGMADIEVEAVKRSKVSDVMTGNDDEHFYKVKVVIECTDERFTFMIQGKDESQAIAVVNDQSDDFTIESITKTKIVEVLR